MILYEPSTAARATRVLELADDISTWGQLRAVNGQGPPEDVEPILQFLWDDWEEGEGAWRFGFDEEEDEVPFFSSRAEFLDYFPDDEELTIETFGDEGPRFMDPFDPAAMGVPEAMRRFYVEQDGGGPASGVWYLANLSGLAEIQAEATRLGLNLVEGSLGDLPHF